MSEMVMVVPVIALTAIVLVGILLVFRKYLAAKDRLDAEFTQSQASAAAASAKPEAKGVVLVQTRRHAA